MALDPIKIDIQVDTKSFESKISSLEKKARDTWKDINQSLKLQLEFDIAQFQSKLSEVKTDLKDATWDREIELRVEANKLQRWLTEAKRNLNNLVNTWETWLSRLQAKFNWLWDKVKAVWQWFTDFLVKSWIVAGVSSLWNAIVDLASKQERYRVVLANSLWSQAQATESLNMLKEVATKTPFTLDEITNSYISLVNRWFKPTSEEIIKLADLSASQWKNFDQLAEALLDAQTWEFERLKEFWVKASVSWDKVAFTFKWVTTEVDKTDEAIKWYVLSLWELNWVQWSTAVQMNTLWWQWSNFKDSLSLAWTELWEKFLPYLKDVTWLLTKLSDSLRSSSKEAEVTSQKYSDLNMELEKQREIDEKILQQQMELKNARENLDISNEEYQKWIEELNKQSDESRSKMQAISNQMDQEVLKTNALKEETAKLKQEKQLLDEQYAKWIITEEKKIEEMDKLYARTKDNVIETTNLTFSVQKYNELKMDKSADIAQLEAYRQQALRNIDAQIKLNQTLSQWWALSRGTLWSLQAVWFSSVDKLEKTKADLVNKTTTNNFTVNNQMTAESLARKLTK